MKYLIFTVILTLAITVLLKHNKDESYEYEVGDTGQLAGIGYYEGSSCNEKTRLNIEKAQKLLANGNINNAESVLKDSFYSEPNCFNVVLSLGAVYHIMGKFIESEFFLKKAINIDPNEPNARASLAWLIVKTKGIDKAIPYFLNTIELENDRIGAHSGIAKGYFKLGEYKLAKKHFLRIIELEPENRLAEDSKIQLVKIKDLGF